MRYLDVGFVSPGTSARVDACLALPGVRSASKATAPPVHGVTVTGGSEAEQFAACVRALAGDGVTLTEHRPPDLDTSVAAAAAPVPPDPEGAQICEGDWGSGGACRDLGPAEAEELAAALASGRQSGPAAAECAASPAVAHQVTWKPASGLLAPVVWTIPVAACLPMTAGDTEYDLDQDARDVVARLWEDAG